MTFAVSTASALPSRLTLHQRNNTGASKPVNYRLHLRATQEIGIVACQKRPLVSANRRR